MAIVRVGSSLRWETRARGSCSPRCPTSGLGLRVSIVERVANAGGQAEIDSAPGEGTVVTIRWPFVDAVLAPMVENPVPVDEEVVT